MTIPPYPASSFPARGFWPESATPDAERDDLALRDLVREFCDRLADRVREVGVGECLTKPREQPPRRNLLRDAVDKGAALWPIFDPLGELTGWQLTWPDGTVEIWGVKPNDAPER
jgi:hypothetical protein